MFYFDGVIIYPEKSALEGGGYHGEEEWRRECDGGWMAVKVIINRRLYRWRGPHGQGPPSASNRSLVAHEIFPLNLVGMYDYYVGKH